MNKGGEVWEMRPRRDNGNTFLKSSCWIKESGKCPNYGIKWREERRETYLENEQGSGKFNTFRSRASTYLERKSCLYLPDITWGRREKLSDKACVCEREKERAQHTDRNTERGRKPWTETETETDQDRERERDGNKPGPVWTGAGGSLSSPHLSVFPCPVKPSR